VHFERFLPTQYLFELRAIVECFDGNPVDNCDARFTKQMVTRDVEGPAAIVMRPVDFEDSARPR